MLFPTRCPVCDRIGAAPCRGCWELLERAPAGLVPLGLDGLRCLLAYDGAGRELLARLKYRNARAALPWIATAMSTLVPSTTSFDVVTWAPTSPPRRRERGFDQAALLASAIGRTIETPVRGLLVRLPGSPQTGRTVTERRRGPRFVCTGTTPLRALVVDDVLTTGATLTAAAIALRAAGTQLVWAVTAGRTPKLGQPEFHKAVP